MDVTKNNFDEILPVILNDIKKSSYIAIDTEFTGILTDDDCKRSFFDSGEDLYKKEIQNLKDVSINQIGLSIFRGAHDSYNYEIKTYNFYICPSSILSIDENVVLQVTSLEFLKNYNFNFNKWLYSGIPCLNSHQKSKLKETYDNFKTNPLQKYLFTRYEVSDKIGDVLKWSKEAVINESLTIKGLNSPTDILCFLAGIYEIDNKGLVASYDNGQIVVTFTNLEESERQKLMLNECDKALNIVSQSMTGFVTVFDALVQARKPIIVHNGLLDLILMFKQFHRPLPENWTDFKAEVHNLFPVVYDTKKIARNLSFGFRTKEGNVLGFLANTALGSVKEKLTDHKIVRFAPVAKHCQSTPKYDDDTIPKYHEAGYDAYCTGYIFLQMSHIYASLLCEKVEQQRPLVASEHIGACEQWCNEIPVQSAGLNFVRLDKDDGPVRHRAWLIVKSRNPFRQIEPANLEALFAPIAKTHIVPRNFRSVLVATSTPAKAENIIRTFNNDQLIAVSRYKAIKHSPLVRNMAWTAALLSTGISTWFALSTWKKVGSIL